MRATGNPHLWPVTTAIQAAALPSMPPAPWEAGLIQASKAHQVSAAVAMQSLLKLLLIHGSAKFSSFACTGPPAQPEGNTNEHSGAMAGGH